MASKRHSKIDHKTLHFLPFTPSRKRTKGFTLQRDWGNWTLDITASETLNTYDLLTLLYIVREYILNGYKAGNIGEREVAGININVREFLKARGILYKKANRQTLRKSIMRLKTINLIFTHKENGKEIHTSYIYEFEVDENIEQIKVYANKAFIEFVYKNGVLINLERLKAYGDKEQYALLLDLYMQGTKKPYRHNKRTYYAYRDRYSFEEIEKALKLDLTKMEDKHKLQKIKEAFEILHKQNNLPAYRYNKTERCFEKVVERLEE